MYLYGIWGSDTLKFKTCHLLSSISSGNGNNVTLRSSLKGSGKGGNQNRNLKRTVSFKETVDVQHFESQ